MTAPFTSASSVFSSALSFYTYLVTTFLSFYLSGAQSLLLPGVASLLVDCVECFVVNLLCCQCCSEALAQGSFTTEQFVKYFCLEPQTFCQARPGQIVYQSFSLSSSHYVGSINLYFSHGRLWLEVSLFVMADFSLM